MTMDERIPVLHRQLRPFDIQPAQHQFNRSVIK